MTPNEYQRLCQRTESVRIFVAHRELSGFLHGVIGIATEAGELLDAAKKDIWYGRTASIANIKEELGDVMWYVACVCNALGLSLEDVMTANIEKLRVRYPEKFTEEKALNRNLDEERKALK